MILTPAAVADLLIYLTWSAGARDAIEGHSVFARPGGGTRLAAPRWTLTAFVRRPWLRGPFPASHVCTEANSSVMSVFDNGMPLTQCDLIDDGHLVNLRASRATSQRFELPTAYLADNLILEDAAGHGDFEDLIARTADAVLITCLWYIREVDPQNLLLTGLTRDGVYRVRDGQIVAGLPNFRFNVSVTDLLSPHPRREPELAMPAARMGRLVHAHRNARAAHRRLQSQQCQRRTVTSVGRPGVSRSCGHRSGAAR